ncbi:hypothetical protein PUN28_017643 [Cardiocondyla obscurior]|uniref:Uncharacterized protein n=1 Tax=Cardiocondyla obscurior TaxID=286306 RepID=A0AAW2EMB1_9HYME
MPAGCCNPYKTYFTNIIYEREIHALLPVMRTRDDTASPEGVHRQIPRKAPSHCPRPLGTPGKMVNPSFMTRLPPRARTRISSPLGRKKKCADYGNEISARICIRASRRIHSLVVSRQHPCRPSPLVSPRLVDRYPVAFFPPHPRKKTLDIARTPPPPGIIFASKDRPDRPTTPFLPAGACNPRAGTSSPRYKRQRIFSGRYVINGLLMQLRCKLFVVRFTRGTMLAVSLFAIIFVMHK